MAEISIPSDDQLARELPEDPSIKTEILKMGLREWRITRALEHHKDKGGSLAFAAEMAGVPLKEMIVRAYGAGLKPEEPQGDLDWRSATEL